ncbi:MAG: LLM class flavin-dependent oxidoreductase [Sphingomonadaceae bacterium]
MKFGVFLPNGSNGYIPSAGAPVYLPTWEHNLAITREAERQELDFVLSMMKYRGFGGETGYWDACLETFTLMAGLAAATSRIGLFPSVTLLAHHPALAARMVATIDQISGGRCGLNIVTGWNRPEYVQMGLWPGDSHYERRYELAADYLGIVKALWRDGRVTHSSEFYQLDDCTVTPHPGRELPIVCAGQSPKGVAFTAAHGDHNFVMAHPAKLRAIVEGVKAEAAKHGRKVGTYALFGLIIADTDAEAHAIGERIIAGADKGAIANILASAALDTNVGGTADRMKEALELPMGEGNIAFMSFPVIWGSPATVAAKIDEVAAATGIDGMLFSWPDFVPGIRDFGEKVRPLLRCA